MDRKVVRAAEVERTTGEMALHRFLVLLVAEVVQRKARTRVGSTPLHKILFNVRRTLQRLAAPDLSIVFMKYHFGPYSPTVTADEKFLREAGLLTASGVTPRGERVIEAFRAPLAAIMPKVMKTIVSEAEHRASWTAERAKKEVYALKVRLNDQVLPMKDVPMGTLFFERTAALEVPAHLLLDLAVALSHPTRHEAGLRFGDSATAAALLGAP